MDIFNAIEEGAKKYGSKKSFYQSSEYAKIYASYKLNKKSDKKVPKKCSIYFSKTYNGFVIEIGSSVVGKSYLAFAGGFLGIGSGIATFKTQIEAEYFASTMKYQI